MQETLGGLKYSGVVVYFNYVFDIGHPVNPIDAAREILKTPVGQAFRNYQTGASEIGNKYKPLADGFIKATKLEEAVNEIKKKPSLLAYLRLINQDPIRILPEYFKIIINALSNSENNSKNTSDEEDEDGTKSIEEIKEWVGSAVSDLLGLLAIHEHVDRDVFYSGYLEAGAFVRIGLQPFRATLFGQSIVYDVTLTVHREGIAILTFYGCYDKTFNLEDICNFKRFSKKAVQDCELPSEIAERYENLIRGYIPTIVPRKKFITNERGFSQINSNQGWKFGDIFDAYRFYVIETIIGKKHWSLSHLHEHLRSTVWYGYPIVFIKKTEPSYSTSSEFKSFQAEELTKLVLGLPSKMPLKPRVIEEIINKDLGIVDDYSLYLNEGNGTVIYHESHVLNVSAKWEGNEWVRQKFMTSVFVDIILFQRAIFHIFNAQLDKATYNLKRLTEIKQEYICALQEIEALGISYYGTVNDIIRFSQKEFRIDDLIKMFLIKLDGIENLIARAEEAQRASREKVVKVLTTLIAVMFSLSAAQGVVDVIVKWPSIAPSIMPEWVNGIYEGIVVTVKSHPTTTTISLYGFAVIVTLFALWHENIIRLGTRKRVISVNRKTKSPELTKSPISFNVEAEETNEK